jgi:hypothetical protein
MLAHEEKVQYEHSVQVNFRNVCVLSARRVAMLRHGGVT